MKKREVLEWPPCRRPDQVAIRNKEDYGHREPYIYYQGRSQIIMSEGRDILNIDIFNGFHLEARYFADKEAGSHAALILATGEWTKMILQNVINKCAGKATDYQNNGYAYYSEYKKWAYASEEDGERVRNYFKSNYRDGLQYWESELQSSRRVKQLINKQNRIMQMMKDHIPEIPEDFYRWMHEDVFGRKYLFMEKQEGKVRHTCGACKETWEQKTGIGRGIKICPKCGAEVAGTYNQKAKAKKKLYMLQPCLQPGRWVERVFTAECIWEPGKETFVQLDEPVRILISDGKDYGQCYYEDGITEDGTRTYWDTNHGIAKTTTGYGYLYPGTLQETMPHMPEGLRHAGLDILAGRMAACNFNNIITTWHRMPWFEYLVKAGWVGLIREITKSPYVDSHTTGLLDKDGETQQEVLQISSGRVDRLRNMGGTFKVLSWLQWEEEHGQKITQENMNYLSRHFWPDGRAEKALGYVKSANMFANYVRRQAKELKETPAQIMITWNDYLDMAKRQKLNLSHEIFYKPKNLKAAHDACVREGHKKEYQKRADEILKKFPDVEKNMDAVREKYTYDGERFCIVVPTGIADIVHEGRALGHCIDTTDRYFDRINKKISYLVFLRRAEAKDTPYYTLEIEPGGTVRQQRTTGNNQNKDDVAEYTPFIREWQAEVWKRLTQADRELAEVSRHVRLEEYRELREKKEKVWNGKLKGLLLADVLEGDLIESLG